MKNGIVFINISACWCLSSKFLRFLRFFWLFLIMILISPFINRIFKSTRAADEISLSSAILVTTALATLPHYSQPTKIDTLKGFNKRYFTVKIHHIPPLPCQMKCSCGSPNPVMPQRSIVMPWWDKKYQRRINGSQLHCQSIYKRKRSHKFIYRVVHPNTYDALQPMVNFYIEVTKGAQHHVSLFVYSYN